MLQVGRQKAEKQQLKNLIFLQGEAEQLPFADASFDLVFSRLAMHHFAQMEPPFWEMVRVLRPGGRLAIIDMQAAPEPLREREDHLETLRDPSHVKNRSLEELLALFKAGGIQPIKQDTTPIAVSLQAWLELTKTPPQICQEIQEALEVELSGGPQTGFEPFVKDGALHFWQRWLFLLGKKQ